MNYLPRWRAYIALLRLHQPIGIFLLLWPALWALWIASAGAVDFKILALFIIGAVLTRSLGCVMNDIADRNLDGFVARTQHRPLATGAVSLKAAVLILLVLSLLAFLVVYQLNDLTIELAGIAVVMMAIYPFTKRYIEWPQLFLGIVFGAWSILMAFAAETGKIPAIAWLLFLAAYGWCVAYDTIYAMVDRDDDRRVGIKSSALALGQREVVFIAILETVFVLLLSLIGFYLKVYWVYYVMLVLVVALLIYQHFLIKDRKPEACFKAFLNNAWIGGLIFLGFFFGLPKI
ncbi:4-hydroxybenzoate octaprenyltransferase [Candidatus Rickettsiella isopodorum]|jgi:4-hydroxybenzoate polyprenyltransferase|uniref:4-hydroxybenzoate octaprenyltransferase n=1 Tax=Candidatus Rickettsiella isopodorum TaxID=1225476 RepID=A0A1J8NJD9_9COXI|nr:4-hydroxybenzoate octaprenyltransferase [Candidatus Rickettsiella isopodorum]MCH9636398.1 4-hydroxybenzoate octaprenyltransferase [Gammaproteobacteria bacterium]MDQ5899760.1 4-hydroxybenzoate octaprenyltransferase [Pseudomonadota bacterium]MCH9755396.1 4-hydroxybenzoate octaprenyltransferase [Gammaproteobacteria bacterium]MDD4893648.1 4-hydroxybenzoate octaprenyltransferase [Candidatus Rickettsiella isopodorum]MDD5161862.1 4-hydroxybenzoate octaprenyltransferase [Candidatus Rickettsiella is